MFPGCRGLVSFLDGCLQVAAHASLLHDLILHMVMLFCRPHVVRHLARQVRRRHRGILPTTVAGNNVLPQPGDVEGEVLVWKRFSHQFGHTSCNLSPRHHLAGIIQKEPLSLFCHSWNRGKCFPFPPETTSVRSFLRYISPSLKFLSFQKRVARPLRGRCLVDLRLCHKEGRITLLVPLPVFKLLNFGYQYFPNHSFKYLLQTKNLHVC